MLLISGYGRDWRGTQSKACALDSPDESLASLSQINTLMSFGWNSPSAPEKTFILMNDLPVDEQLISSLPETPGVRFRVKKDSVAGGSESAGTESRNVRENRSDESPKQVSLLPRDNVALLCRCPLVHNAGPFVHPVRLLTLKQKGEGN